MNCKMHQVYISKIIIIGLCNSSYVTESAQNDNHSGGSNPKDIRRGGCVALLFVYIAMSA